ncbi:MAG: hypothetical protein AB8B65_08220 [Kordia sp.]|uniref:hypothetical protein n=1 Tax=Kordia sp. TaxID=1965332 RepID=UPI00385A8322
MKKQIKTLALKKQTISSLKIKALNGGAPTTITMQVWCVSQRNCEPLPQDPRPLPDTSRVLPCGSWNRPDCPN